MFGVLPALQLSRTNHLQAMGSRGARPAAARRALRTVLVVGQLVMATVLLVGAGLLVAQLLKLSHVNKGYDPSHVLAFNLLFPDRLLDRAKGETIEALLTRLRAEPGRARRRVRVARPADRR